MQHNNIRHSNYFNKQNISELNSSLLSVLENSGIKIKYFLYDNSYEEFNVIFDINCYIEKNNFTNLEMLMQSSKVFDIFLLSSDFLTYSNQKSPSKKDKIQINSDFYYILDIQYYNTINKLLETIDNSLLIKLTVTKRDSLKRTEL